MIITDDEMNIAYDKINNFIKEYSLLFDEVINSGSNLNNIIMKYYIINEDRKYLFGSVDIGSVLADKYNNEELSGQDLNFIINILIEVNKRNYIYNKNEYLTNLILYKDCITYFIIGKGYFYYIIKMLRNNKVTSAKIILDNKEYYLNYNDKDEIFKTEKIYDENCYETILGDIEIIFNGVEYEKRLL